MSSLIIGVGEIGQALYKVLSPFYPTFTYDKEYPAPDPTWLPQVDILHICFGYSPTFIEDVKAYQKQYSPKFTIIHSTVPTGTSRQCGAIHSPVIGQHPFLCEGLKTFPKMLGGKDASEVADYFRRAGFKVILFDKPETTEASKLFLTEYYRECIEFAKRVKSYTDKHGLNFSEVYTIPNTIYNEGYKQLGYPEFVRPILQPIMTPVGGHCVEPNKELIKQSE